MSNNRLEVGLSKIGLDIKYLHDHYVYLGRKGRNVGITEESFLSRMCTYYGIDLREVDTCTCVCGKHGIVNICFLLDPETNEYIMLGTTCVKKFLGENFIAKRSCVGCHGSMKKGEIFCDECRLCLRHIPNPGVCDAITREMFEDAQKAMVISQAKLASIREQNRIKRENDRLALEAQRVLDAQEKVERDREMIRLRKEQREEDERVVEETRLYQQIEDAHMKAEMKVKMERDRIAKEEDDIRAAKEMEDLRREMEEVRVREENRRLEAAATEEQNAREARWQLDDLKKLHAKMDRERKAKVKEFMIASALPTYKVDNKFTREMILRDNKKSMSKR